MWEPVLQDKRQEHIKFCKYAAELIELVSGKPPHTAVDPSLDRIRRVSYFSYAIENMTYKKCYLVAQLADCCGSKKIKGINVLTGHNVYTNIFQLPFSVFITYFC